MHPLLLLVFALWCFSAWAEILEGKVVGVVDGDTITLLDSNRQQHKIRLAGIDAPGEGAAVRSALEAAPGRSRLGEGREG